MSVRVSDKLFYFLPQTNKSNLSTSLPQFTKDTNSFEFKLRMRPQWDKLKEGTEYGVLMINGKHLGISMNTTTLVGTVWTDEPKQVYLPLDYGSGAPPEIIDCEFKVDNVNRTLTMNSSFGCEEEYSSQSIEFEGELADDYKWSYLWLGCACALEDVPDDFKWKFFGHFEYLEIIRNEKPIFKSFFRRMTNFKIFDESDCGNHFIKYSKEWFGE